MQKKVDILNGDIAINLFRLALPIILTSLVSILYNLTDIKFISTYLGDNAVAAAAAATFFLSFTFALLIISKNGAQIYVAQSIGAKIYRNARAYARIALICTLIFSILCTLVGLIFSRELIILVGVTDENLLKQSIIFLRFCCIGIPFFFLSNTMSAIISADGDTFGPFVFNTIGVLVNIFLDFFFLAILKFGIEGAAIATSISQIISFLLILIYFKSPKSKFRKMKLFKLDKIDMYIKLIKIGIPSGISQALFTVIAILLANVIAKYDQNVLAVQRLGVQFESFSWNIAGGLSSAVATYIAQNYGAKKYERINKVYRVALNGISLFACIITFVFIVFARPLFENFLEDPILIEHGVNYLKIIGLTQIFQCVEIVTTGAFNGIGKINQPTLIGIIGTGARVPMAYIFAPLFGITAIWWIISMSMFFKGIISYIIFKIIWKRFLKGVCYENSDSE